MMKYIASKNAPDSNSAKYWIDLTTNPYGGAIKFWNGKTWDFINNADDQDRDIVTLKDYVKTLTGQVVEDNHLKSCTPAANKLTLSVTKDKYTIQNNGSITSAKDTAATNVDLPAATTAMAGVMQSTDKAKLDGIEALANKYVLPKATDSVLGGIKIGFATVADLKKYGLSLDGDSKAYITIPVDSIINNTLTSDSTTISLSAAQGKVLKGLYDGLTTKLNELTKRVEALEHPAPKP